MTPEQMGKFMSWWCSGSARHLQIHTIAPGTRRHILNAPNLRRLRRHLMLEERSTLLRGAPTYRTSFPGLFIDAELDRLRKDNARLRASCRNWEAKYDRVRRALDPEGQAPESMFSLEELALGTYAGIQALRDITTHPFPEVPMAFAARRAIKAHRAAARWTPTGQGRTYESGR